MPTEKMSRTFRRLPDTQVVEVLVSLVSEEPETIQSFFDFIQAQAFVSLSEENIQRESSREATNYFIFTLTMAECKRLAESPAVRYISPDSPVKLIP